MALNRFFNNYNHVPQQDLLVSLGVEMIQIYGVDFAYLKRSHTKIDPLFLEDPLSFFDDVRFIEMYINDYFGYGQQSDMMTKFGMSMPDRITVSVMRTRFGEEFPDMIRPLEGDLLYLPMAKALFEIKYVEHEDNFYQHGALQYFNLTCERFVYSSEKFETGNAEIDRIEQKYSLALTSNYEMTDETGVTIVSEDGLIAFTDERFGKARDDEITDEVGRDITDEAGNLITSNKAHPMTPLVVQNEYFDKEARKIIDFSEINPFGT